MAERIGFDFEGEITIAFVDPGEVEDSSTERKVTAARLSSTAAEGSEIVFAEKGVGAEPHHGQVEGFGDVPGLVCPQRIRIGPVLDLIAVAAGAGAEPGMKIGGDDLGVTDDDLISAELVEGASQL